MLIFIGIGVFLKMSSDHHGCISATNRPAFTAGSLSTQVFASSGDVDRRMKIPARPVSITERTGDHGFPGIKHGHDIAEVLFEDCVSILLFRGVPLWSHLQNGQLKLHQLEIFFWLFLLL